MNAGIICVCAQPLRDNVTMKHHLSLAGCIHKMIPGMLIHISQKHSEISAILIDHEIIRNPWKHLPTHMEYGIDGSMQKRCNFIAKAHELHFFCIEPSR